MPNKNDILREKTFKDQDLDTERRVFYTLTTDENLISHRTSKALASLVGLLLERQILTESDIDDLLIECIH